MTDGDKGARWVGRHADKDTLRRDVWSRLERDGANIGPVWSAIPNFAGADLAAKRLSELPAWRRAAVIKCNPDPPQIPVRLRALYDGKTVFAPVPELRTGTPFVKLDPVRLKAEGIQFELAAVSQGFLRHGEPVEFEDMPYLPFCVVGCVAVSRAGGRTGKGAGFADLELGIFRELGKVDADTVIATTVHSSQVVPEDRIPMQAHDSALHAIATEADLIRVDGAARQPAGVDWDQVKPDQFASIPFLSALRERLERR
ncbi:5-formyltetrahydrofolate cyclo-ligase [Lichenibacterium ramalinae]|uniref:5-formyltetrahydrofolate cyclo-ligase n=1 Tax=Lichenibacterium ramalinae TaxID=2316527 RepID=A0A4Q2R581_9HYPH|nr:5-formyltetrahydrofolate cyclo-ligase [Lichenibacterium ramalinae]RYB01502.1 5-formyltetrahydrofolate cyclo-ligase [Lichenibacterium ramalinae]